MAGLVPAIHVFTMVRCSKSWMPGTSPGMTGPVAMIGFASKGREHIAARDRVREWTRAHFKLPEEATVLVAEVSCALPGCVPLETVIAFWSEQGRHHFKVFKPVADVVRDDFPPPWMKPALLDIEGIGCACCG
jgi:nitrate reductase delta subunit